MLKTSERLLSLLSMLQARRDWPGALLAERLDVSARTVRRDVDRLRELGYPIAAVKGPDGGYRLEPGSELPPLLFDDDQAVALAVALRVATQSGAGIEEAAARALATVRQVMPARLRHRIDHLDVTTVSPPPSRPATQVDSRVLVALADAVHRREGLRFDYALPQSADASVGDAPVAPRLAEPHHLVTWGGRWYVVAWDLARGDWRTFRADRMTLRSPGGARFAPREVPGGDVSTYVASTFRGSHDRGGTGAWPCQGEVILSLAADEVSPYTSDGTVEPLGPDRCRLVQGSWSWIGLAATIGRFDAEVESVEPVELRDAFARLAGRLTRAALAPDESPPLA